MKILISEANNFSEDALKIYKTLGQVIEVDSDWKAIKKHINEIDILVIKLAFNFDESFLKKASCLKIIATSTTGLNHIKLPKNSNIEVVSLKNESKFLSEITPTAELTWGLILSLVRNIHSSIQSVKKKKWERNKFIGNELKGRTLGIIGFGRIGEMLARYGNAFGMKVQFYDIEDKKANEKKLNYKQVNLIQLLKTSDIISLNIISNKSNINFLNMELINNIKPGAYFVNTSRGDVLDEEYILERLEKNYLEGVALDVLRDEHEDQEKWTKNNKLMNSKLLGNRLIITPHIGGACTDSMLKTEIFIAKKVFNLINNKKNDK